MSAFSYSFPPKFWEGAASLGRMALLLAVYDPPPKPTRVPE